MRGRLTAAVEFELSDLRGAALAMLGAGVVLPLLPGHAGLPCPLRTLTGVPCPLCGMTTSVEATMHAHPVAALQANPAGPLLVLIAAALLIRRPSQPLQLPLVAVILLAAVLWVFELHRFSIL